MTSSRSRSSNSPTRKPNSDNIWFLVSWNDRAKGFDPIVDHLEAEGYEVQLVAITDVIGSVTRDAVAGGAERILRNLQVMFGGEEGQKSHFLGAFRRARPDAVVLTLPHYVRALGLLQRLTGIQTAQIGVLDDYNLPDDWFRGALKQLVVPHRDMTETALERGFKSQAVSVGGPPLEPTFIDSDWTPAEAKSSLGLDHDELMLLVRADNFSQYLIDTIVFQLTLIEPPVRVVFDHQGNPQVAQQLREAADKNGLPASMFGGVKELSKYYTAADLALVAPTDDYIPELLFSNCPLVFAGEPQSQNYQSSFLTQKGVARSIEKLRLLGGELSEILTDSDFMSVESEALLYTAEDPNLEVAERIESFIDSDLQQLLPDADYTDTNASANDGDSAGFESIGDQDRATKPKKEAAASRSDRDDEVVDPQEKLTELIMLEKELQSEIEQLQSDRRRWRERLELARDWEESELSSRAESRLDGLESKLKSHREHLESVQKRKQRIKEGASRARSNEGSPESDSNAVVEERFREMELERDLESLKDRIDRELGDTD